MMDLQKSLATEIGFSLLHEHPDAVVVLDPQQRIYALNKAAEALFEYTSQDLLGEPLDRLLPPDAVERHRGHVQHFGEQGHAQVSTMYEREPVRARKRDGTEFPIEATIGVQWHQGHPYFYAIVRDLTERFEREQTLLRQRNLYQALSRSNQLLIRSPPPEELYDEVCRIVVDASDVPLAWVGLIDSTGQVQPAAYHGEASGYLEGIEVTSRSAEASGQGMIGQAIREAHPVIVPYLTEDPRMQPWHEQARAFGLASAGAFPITRGGAVVGTLNVYARQSAFFAERQGIVELFNELAADISAALEHHDERLRIQQLSYRHFVTGLPNRASLKERVEEEAARLQRQPGLGAIILIDIDGFKAVNDSLGYRLGDETLQRIAERIREHLHGNEVLYHLGADEFVVLALDLAGEETESAARSHRIADGIRQGFLAPLQAGERDLQLTASLGMTLFPGTPGESGDSQAGSAEGILQEVSLALARAKEEGGNQVRFFDPQLRHRAERYIHMVEGLRLAPERGELAVAYQPLWDLASEELLGLEALMRWRHPELGWVSPAEFIPLAERSNTILELGDWILEQVLRQIATWQEEGVPPLPLGVTVNVSAAQFKQERWVESVRTRLERSRVAGQCLKMEVTETLLMESVDTALDKIGELRDLGIRFALDDFGTGYSSMTYLQRLPLDYLKVDRSFIQSIGQEPAVEGILDAILGLSRSLGLQTIAEGVETEHQAAFLRARGCPIGQGFYWSPPLAPEAVAPLLPRAGRNAR